MDTEKTNQDSQLGTGLAWVGLIIMTTLVMIRTMVEHDPFPMWSSDPFGFSPPVIGLTPTKALVLNLAVVLSCLLTMLGLFLRKQYLGFVPAGLLCFGLAIIAHHGFHTHESFLEGSSLLAMICVLITASQAHKLGQAKQIIAAITLSFAMVLVIIGAYEMLVIHPATIIDYKIHQDSFLAARGWMPGSFEALAYERRLYQAEPIAWFGLTNVFASFAGACSAGLLVLGWMLRKSDRLWGLFVLAGLIALAGLGMTGAKGGFGAFALGLILVAGLSMLKRSRLDRWAISGMCGLVIAGVITRGLVGERLGELSLLFRSQYMVGSMRMFLENPIFGVSPGAFQDHYAVVKPDLSPETVASAHSLPFDLIATLGLGGIALVVLLAWIGSQIRLPVENRSIPKTLPPRQATQLALLIVAIASVISIRFGSPAMDSSMLMVQFCSSVLWGLLAAVLIRRVKDIVPLQYAIFAAAAVLAIHAMIEVTAIWMVSGMLWALMIGCACSADVKNKSPRLGRLTQLGHGGMMLVMIGAVGTFGLRVPSVMTWESHLYSAAQPAFEFAAQRQLEIQNKNARFIKPEEFGARMQASEQLIEASRARPLHMPTRIAASQQMFWITTTNENFTNTPDTSGLWDQGIALIEEGLQLSPGASGYQWLGSVWESRARLSPLSLPPIHPPEILQQFQINARDCYIAAFEYSPHSPHLALRIMNLSVDLRDAPTADRWARIALRLHEQSRLDPLKGLSETDLWPVKARVGKAP